MQHSWPGAKSCKCVSVTRDFKVNQKDNRTSDTADFMCKHVCCHFYTYCKRAAPKERRKSGCCQRLKYVKDVCCVDQFSFIKPVTNVPTVALDLPVGARLHEFWETWEALGASSNVLKILKEGYTPFRIQPNLTRSWTIISSYVNPLRNSYLTEALHPLMKKSVVELVKNQRSLGFFNWLFLFPEPNNCWRPILDLISLNHFLKAEKFKMETPETIRTFLQQGDWVTSIAFKDAYIPYYPYRYNPGNVRFHIRSRSYQYKALQFGLSTAPMEFIKRPARDACLCMGELQAPHFVFLITL